MREVCATHQRAYSGMRSSRSPASRMTALSDCWGFAFGKEEPRTRSTSMSSVFRRVSFSGTLCAIPSRIRCSTLSSHCSLSYWPILLWYLWRVPATEDGKSGIRGRETRRRARTH